MANKPQGKNKIYYPRCRTCAYMKAHPEWYAQLKKTTYFDQGSPETPGEFYKRTAPPFPERAFYNHLQHHTYLSKKLVVSAKQRQGKDGRMVTNDQAAELSQTLNVAPETDYIDALDDTIKRFHTAVKNKQIPMTLQGGLQAIKIRADIDKANRDRKLDAFKAFAGMKGNGEVPHS